MLCKCSWFRAKTINQRCTSYNLKRKLFDRKLIFFLMKKGIHIMNPKKQNKVYVAVLLFILYSIWIHVETRNTKWFAKNHQNQVHLLFVLTNSGQKSLTMFILSCFNSNQLNFEIRELGGNSNPQSLSV